MMDKQKTHNRRQDDGRTAKRVPTGHHDTASGHSGYGEALATLLALKS